jgi:hypothetical protein
MDHTAAKLLCLQVPQQLLPTYQPDVREKEIPSHGTGTGTTAVRNFMLWICLGIDLHCLAFFIVFSPGFLGMSGHHLRTRAESWDQTIVMGIPQSMIRLHLSLKIALFFLDLKTQNELHTILDTILSSARSCLNEMPAFTKKSPREMIGHALAVRILYVIYEPGPQEKEGSDVFIRILLSIALVLHLYRPFRRSMGCVLFCC